LETASRVFFRFRLISYWKRLTHDMALDFIHNQLALRAITISV
jgi:hypothetical protein